MKKYFSYHWKTILVCTAVFLLAGFFRLYNLQSIPPNPLHDEVSNGYNAYSILKTGADEFGTKFPLLLRAYDDWRPALFTYVTVPFVFVFNLSIFSIRFPSVLLSLASLVVLYFLVSELLVEKITVLGKPSLFQQCFYMPSLPGIFFSLESVMKQI